MRYRLWYELKQPSRPSTYNLDKCYINVTFIWRQGFLPPERPDLRVADRIEIQARLGAWQAPGIHAKSRKHIWGNS